MSTGSSMLPEFDQEMATTRRLLERVPDAKGEWKPHPKSFALGHLAQLVARMPGWLPSILGSDALDLGQAPGYTMERTNALLDEFDRNVREARTALSTVSDADLGKSWSLKRGNQVFFTAPKGAVARRSKARPIMRRALRKPRG